MYRDIVHLGPITIRSYGVALVLAFVLAAWLLYRRAPRFGIPSAFVPEFVQVALIAGVLGARVMYVVAHWGDFAAEPWHALAIWEGGLTYYGGFILAAVAAIWWGRRRGIDALTVGDLLSPAVALGEGIGRIGCFFNGCCFGRPTSVPWAVRFPPGSYADSVLGAVPVHPSQLYQSAWGLAVFGFLLAMGVPNRRGTVFWTFLIVLPLGRAVLDQFRWYDPESCVTVGGATIPVSSIIAMGLVLVGVVGYAVGRGRPRASAEAA